MDGERYPGERRGLGLFLHELLPVVDRLLGRDTLLFHRIDRALRRGDLASLRAARQMFNNQPRDIKQALSRELCAGPGPGPTRVDLLERCSRRRAGPFVRFEDGADGGSVNEPPSVAMDHELLHEAPVQVYVRPDSLPSAVAESLRRIAARIEGDRRLLSARYWQGAARPAQPGGGDRDDDTAEWR
jgi:hypothetical protein